MRVVDDCSIYANRDQKPKMFPFQVRKKNTRQRNKENRSKNIRHQKTDEKGITGETTQQENRYQEMDLFIPVMAEILKEDIQDQ